jgi:hypothetical protein
MCKKGLHYRHDDVKLQEYGKLASARIWQGKQGQGLGKRDMIRDQRTQEEEHE